MRSSILRILDKLFDALTDVKLFPHLYVPLRRSTFNEYMYATGAKELEIYKRMTSNFEAHFKVTGKNPQGPKQYHIALVPEPRAPVQGKEGAKVPRAEINLQAVTILLNMGTYFFYHLRLYDAGQELLESVLLTLFQARSFDGELGKGDPHLYATMKEVPTVVEVVYALAKSYMMRFLAFYEVALNEPASSTQSVAPSVYKAYSAIIHRPPRSRGKASAIRSTIDLFLVEHGDDIETRQVAVETSSVDLAATVEARKQKLQFDPAKMWVSQSRVDVVGEVRVRVG